MPRNGYIQVYTGNGKGKTCAALGLALRAAGWGMRTYVAQFLKKGLYGELRAARRFIPDLIRFEQFGSGGFHRPGKGISSAEKRAAQRGLRSVQRAMVSGSYQIVILDEINTLLHFQIVEVAAVLKLFKQKPRSLELILTGRYAPAAVVKRADLVTEMKEIRHYFTRGIPARRGIEK